MTRDANESGGYIVEFLTMGDYVKVSAIDPVTRREVSIVGDPAAGKTVLTRIAVQKLQYVLTRGNK